MTNAEIKNTITSTLAQSAGLVAIRTDLSKAISDFNEAKAKNDVKAMAIANTAITNAEDEYAAKAMYQAFDLIRGMGDTMVPAIIARSYPVASHKDEKLEDSEETVRKLVDVEKIIDLRKYDLYCKKTYGAYASADPECWAMVETLQYLLVCDAAKTLNAEMPKNYKFGPAGMSNTITTKEVVGASNSALIKPIQRIIDAIVAPTEDEKHLALSCDAKYLRTCSASKGKELLSVKAAKGNAMRDSVAQMIYRIITNGQYSVLYQQAKAKA